MCKYIGMHPQQPAEEDAAAVVVAHDRHEGADDNGEILFLDVWQMQLGFLSYVCAQMRKPFIIVVVVVDI
jgi:hypothetical protein